MIAYEIVVSLILLLIAILLIILTLQATKDCPDKKQEEKEKKVLYQEPNYEVIAQETRPEDGALVWDNGKTLNPIIVPIYNPEDYYTDYYGDYYQGVTNKEMFQNENEMPNYSQLDDVLYENQIDVLLKSTSQVFQDQQINYLEDEIAQLEERT